MRENLLKVNNLCVDYVLKQEVIRAVDNLSFEIQMGESVGIIGESGSGKTSIAMAICDLLKDKAHITGEVSYKGVDVLKLTEAKKRSYRWNDIAIVFQNRLDILNPVLKIGKQLEEAIKEHTNLGIKEIKTKINIVIKNVNIDEYWLNVYPHQLSGGMRQKILIAMALVCDPSILILDEPTSSLDSISKKEISDLIKTLREKQNVTTIVISHELGVINDLTSKILVLYKGRVLEEGDTIEVLKNPKHNYTRGVINSSLEINPYQDLWGIPSNLNEKKTSGCAFYNRCTQAIDSCKEKSPELTLIDKKRKIACNRGGIVTLIKAFEISKKYKAKNKEIQVCNKCNIEIKSGEIVALIGHSGSGKTTLASIISGFEKKDGGHVEFEGVKITGFDNIRKLNGVQMIFQDPFSSINGSFTVKEAIEEPLKILKIIEEQKMYEKVQTYLSFVQLPNDINFMNKKCEQLSGGQRQRVALARGLIMNPKVLIADEISSMLDPSTKANILRLLKSLQFQFGFSMLFITHDLHLARKIAHKIFVMKEGNIIETGTTMDIFNNPQCAYTHELVNMIK